MSEFTRPVCKYEEKIGNKLIIETIPVTVFDDDLVFYDSLHAGVLHYMAKWKRCEYGYMVEELEPGTDNKEGIKIQVLKDINRQEFERSDK